MTLQSLEIAREHRTEEEDAMMMDDAPALRAARATPKPMPDVPPKMRMVWPVRSAVVVAMFGGLL